MDLEQANCEGGGCGTRSLFRPGAIDSGQLFNDDDYDDRPWRPLEEVLEEFEFKEEQIWGDDFGDTIICGASLGIICDDLTDQVE